MKTTKFMRWALCIACIAALNLVGCEKLDPYSIDAPIDLQERIDSIAAAKASVDTGDTTYIDVVTTVVGAEDYTSAWWTAFSDYFTVPTNELLHLEFVNHNGGSANNWNNWNLCIANLPDRDDENYKEYFVVRSDAFGWGNGDFNLDLLTNNFPDTDGDEDIWNDFRATMDGATVSVDVDHSITGNVFLTATSIGTNGTELVMTYQHPVSATEDVVAFLISDASYFEIENAYLLPSKITVIEDSKPVSINITETSAFVEIGNEDFWGKAIATVTFDDGTSEQVDTADVSFKVIPDMTTLGEKNILVSYNKTKKGEFTDAVVNMYTLEVTNSVSQLVITEMPELTKYYYFDNSSGIVFDTTGVVITATYSDGTTGIMDNKSLVFGEIPAAEGAQNAVVSFEGATSTVTVNCPITVVKGLSQVGANDFSTAWWSQFSDDYTVASGTSKTLTMYCYSNEVNNWHSPCTILRKADNTEYGVVRMDSFGWGDGYAAATVSNDWDFDAMKLNLNGSKVIITVTNNGDNTADVNYDVTYNNGETHFQKYKGITIDSSDLNCALVLEGSYLVITE